MVEFQDIINHPVHIVDENNSLSPSAFIPFCEFGGDMSALGVKIDQFSVPVCNSFKAKRGSTTTWGSINLGGFDTKNHLQWVQMSTKVDIWLWFALKY